MRRQKALTQTANSLRPLARLALMTARPPRVFMRTKKPWVRARRVFDGWYVRFMVGLSSSKVNRGLSLFFSRLQRKKLFVCDALPKKSLTSVEMPMFLWIIF